LQRQSRLGVRRVLLRKERAAATNRACIGRRVHLPRFVVAPDDRLLEHVAPALVRIVLKVRRARSRATFPERVLHHAADLATIRICAEGTNGRERQQAIAEIAARKEVVGGAPAPELGGRAYLVCSLSRALGCLVAGAPRSTPMRDRIHRTLVVTAER